MEIGTAGTPRRQCHISHLADQGFIVLILGLLLFIGAGVIGTEGILDNRGASHRLPSGFNAFGYTMHGPTGQLFFWGIVVGSVAMLGLVLIFGGLRAAVKRRSLARKDAALRKNNERETQPVAVPVTPELVSVPSERSVVTETTRPADEDALAEEVSSRSDVSADDLDSVDS
jgi:hypothetical protein